MAEYIKGDNLDLFMRISDIVKEPIQTLIAIDDLQDVPLVPLEIAVESLTLFLPKIASYASTAKERCENPRSDGMSVDESAAIMLYTMGWKPTEKCLYVVLNATLRSEDRSKRKHWLFYLKLFLTAVSKIPSQHRHVFRGIKEDLHEYYPSGKTIVWESFSSCTVSIDILQSNPLLGTSGKRTIFDIECNSSKDISQYSYCPKDKEVIIMAATQFIVTGCLNQGNDLVTIQLKETKPSHHLPQPVTHFSESKKTYRNKNDDQRIRSVQYRLKYSATGEHDLGHSNELESTELCRDGGRCENMDPDHLKAYRHVPLCRYRLECVDFIRGSAEHCRDYRHCKPTCRFGHFCVKFHDEKHFSEENHPFQSPCPFTPFHCRQYNSLCETNNTRTLPIDVQKHCLQYSHVCRYGRQCYETSDIHWKTTIHVIRNICSWGDKCTKIDQEDHLTSFSHPGIVDIRRLCPYQANACRDKQKPEHIKQYRHNGKHDSSGVISCFGQNNKTNFVKNQERTIQAINKYAKTLNPNNILSIPMEIQKWIKGLQPVHRCSKVIFESILVHGHVMSRSHMENLKSPLFVAQAVQEHKRIRGIFDRYKTPAIEDHVKEYIRAIVSLEYSKKHSGITVTDATPSKTPMPVGSDDYYDTILKKERIFPSLIKPDEVIIIKNCAIGIAEASWNLHNSPSGIGYSNDKALGTDKHVFSVLGPHLGHYYGDICLVFKSDVMFHPDTNFSPQAATSFMSGRTFLYRPWIKDPGTSAEKIRCFHESKLHCAISGYEYAVAAELIAVSGLEKKTLAVDLKTIINRWTEVDAHQVLEAHLPQLVPLDYIEEVYIPRNLFASLTSTAQESAQKVFRDALHITNHDINLTDAGGTGPHPLAKNRSDYQDFVTNTLIKKFEKRKEYEKHFRGFSLTLAPSQCMDHTALPLTISDAYDQYCRIHKRSSHDDKNIYIYWEAMYGDMMLTLSDEPINPHVSQPHIRCLVCYIAERPATTTLNYNESYSYLNAGEPFRHGVIKTDGRCSSSSQSFHRGCNVDDFLTYCLRIDKNTGQITLSHAGPNSIYCYETITCKFFKASLDLNKLQYIHVSAGSQKVPVRNLIISFELMSDLHPSFDTNFKRGDDAFPRSKKSYDVDRATSIKTPPSDSLVDGVTDKKLAPCQYSINCRLQESAKHIKEYSHPCPYSEICRYKNNEPHLTHEPRRVEQCPWISSCQKLDDPVHRAKYRHPGYPDFIMPCCDGINCRNKTSDHRTKYSHGELIDINEFLSSRKLPLKYYSKHDEVEDTDIKTSRPRTPCRYGSGCSDQSDSGHSSTYSHPSDIASKRLTSASLKRVACRYGHDCPNQNDYDHCSQYSHPCGE
ncbi:unnamed protein product [Rotaria socialis]|uniref:NAD(P)(+)--arginine ADP-ribosyltransferase n=2 Tax=Rotaria socialis TaxID=392032 RepID=A0A820WCY0_9BILA|nr:unnamed protein product [Rotaria socialis]CAF4513000.1 unnamed protein product [Rotaria socialis]